MIQPAFIRSTLLSSLRFPVAAAVLCVLAAGCVSLKKPNPEKRYYVLDVKRESAPAAVKSEVALWVPSVEVSPQYGGREFVYRTGKFAYTTDYYNLFLIAPDTLMTEQLLSWLSDSGRFTSVRQRGARNDSWLLTTSVPRFYADFTDKSSPKAVLEMQTFLSGPKDESSRFQIKKDYLHEIPLSGRSADLVVAGWNQALREILTELESDLAEAVASRDK